MATATPAPAEPIVADPQSPRVETFERTFGPQRIAELDRAIQSFKQQRYDEALKLLQAANKKKADLPPARLLLAELFFSNNQATLGQAVLEQAAVENPGHPGVYLTSAVQSHADGRRTDALVLYEKAEALAESKKWTDRQRRSFLIRVRSGRSLIAEDRRDWPAAQEALSAWLELEPKNGLTRERLARALFFLNQQQEAHAELRQARQDDPSLKSAAINLGLLYLEQGDLDKAAQWMRSAVKQAPDDARAHLELGHCLLKQGRIPQAKARADAAAKLDSDLRELKILRGLIALASKDYEEAERQYLAVLHESPEDNLARDKLALALVEQPSEVKRRRALELAHMNVRLYPNAAWPLSTVGWVYYRLGRLPEAERALRAAVSSPAAKPDAAYHLARMLADQGHNEEAKQLLEQALEARIGDFTFRREAKKHLDQLTKTSR